MSLNRQIGSILLLSTVGPLMSVAANAACPCQRGAAGASIGFASSNAGAYDSYHATPHFPDQSFSSPTFDDSFSGVTPGAQFGGSPDYSGVGPGFSGATATTWQPPAGTLGRTYQIKSRPVPVNMHPRAALVDVRVRDAKSVRVHDMNAFRTEEYLIGFQDHTNPSMWHFTAEALLPGISHIYRIEARFDGPNGETVQERYVRLIMGRVIELDF